MDDVSMWYVAHVFPNHAHDLVFGPRGDADVWRVRASCPDEALSMFEDHVKPKRYRVLCVTEDYGSACEALLSYQEKRKNDP
jgi:hypothetical protein